MTTSIANVNIDKLIIRLAWNFIDKETDENKLLKDIKELLNALKDEVKYINCEEISNTFNEITQRVYPNHKPGDKLVYLLYYDIFATLFELYIKIIDVKDSI